MRRCSLSLVTFAVTFLALVAACERTSPMSSTSVVSPLSPSAVSPAAAAVPDRIVTMQDACDPETFNAALGPGTCVRSGGVEFATFLEQLGKHGVVGGWLFAPSKTTARVGQVFLAVNRGGEAHTFTEVDEFGGGFVTDLNELSNNPVMAPECGALPPTAFVAPGATYENEPLQNAGISRFQCCIHPWMRLEARVMEK